ncbi:methyl-accepting chemotaxis protein [Sodalis ligni]|uniref:Methyl-accepting chemotaxis protein/methyl-accepting chemotaxis protein-2 (Aspartate sensor receptor) n=1 Tax=Sodalis ligni TaxID=2697027 RepID=A0A4R1NDZ4_9GAMM|nr:methyl-accepting chemotaxis protein [Sodalis ligni]TCL05059.1 methyl-accepting chemotaxis protein/methyl-accepting chemotaxis protein-2 (aspartate sensor receptor) [Sodalis ligni]
MRLANIKIGRRLTIGFTLLLILILLSGVISIFNLAKFNKNIIRIVSVDYPVTVSANNIVDEFNQIIATQQYILLAADSTGVNHQINHIIDIRKQIGEEYDSMASALTDPPSMQILKDLITVRQDFIASNKRFEAAMLSGDKTTATREFMETSLPLIAEYRSGIKKFIALQDSKMLNSQFRVSEDFKLIRLVLIILILGSLAMGILIAWRITLSITHPLQRAVNVARKVAEGDLTGSATITAKDETGLLLRALEDMNINLHRIVQRVRDGAEAIAAATAQIASGNQDLSSRTEEQAASIEETAASLEQLTSTIKNTAANTAEATDVSARASGIVKHNGELMGHVTDKMRSIRKSSESMSEIIGVIDSIAFQTNILALNAAVEAARAGENGRGFAVVASEVRALAQRSATAAKEIKNLIDESVNQIHDGMKLVEEAGTSMADMVANVNNVTDIIKEISQASNEQSDGIHQINVAVGQIDSSTQQNAALVEEAASAAVSLQAQAASLTQIVSTFKLTSASLADALSHHEAIEDKPSADQDPQPAKEGQPGKGESWASF